MVRFGPVRVNQVDKCFFVKIAWDGDYWRWIVNIRNDIKAVENH